MSHLTSEQTEAVIGPLHPHYTYNFTIVAFTLVGSGPTTYVIVRTDEDGKAIIHVLLTYNTSELTENVGIVPSDP